MYGAGLLKNLVELPRSYFSALHLLTDKMFFWSYQADDFVYGMLLRVLPDVHEYLAKVRAILVSGEHDAKTIYNEWISLDRDYKLKIGKLI
jgi:hypothetical protein